MANKYTRKGRERGNAPNETFPVDDQFVSLSARGWIAIQPYLRQVGYGIVGLAVLLAVMWGLLRYRTGAREEATEMFGRAVRIYEADLLTGDEKPKADDDTPRFKTAKERADATLAEIDRIEKKHGSTGVAREARALRAGVLYDQGNFAEAEKAWRAVADGAPKDDPMRTVARESVGLCLENEGKVDEALAIYKEVESSGGGFLRDRAQLDQGRALALKGNKAEAEKLFRELLGRVPQGGLHDEIQSRLAALGG